MAPQIQFWHNVVVVLCKKKMHSWTLNISHLNSSIGKDFIKKQQYWKRILLHNLKSTAQLSQMAHSFPTDMHVMRGWRFGPWVLFMIGWKLLLLFIFKFIWSSSIFWILDTKFAFGCLSCIDSLYWGCASPLLQFLLLPIEKQRKYRVQKTSKP